MKSRILRCVVCLYAALFAGVASSADDSGARCEAQARQILDRLEAEVVGQLRAAQRATANEIVLDVCHAREAQVEVEVEAAVQQAREEEQEKAAGWFTNSGNKAGNKRLKRKQN
ncbi:MAG: hypothetical protein ACPG1A_08195 [Halioglobus sp.]